MSTLITCPNCAAVFEPSAAMEQSIREKYKTEFNQKWLEQKKKQEEEFRLREEQLRLQVQEIEKLKAHQEEELKTRLSEELRKREAIIQQELAKKIAFDFESKLKFLEESNKEREAQLREARLKEIEFLKKEEVLARKEQEMELQQQKLIREERERLAAELRQQNELREKEMLMEFQLKQKEWEVRFEQQTHLLEEAQRKATQNSMQLQGEAQEIVLEELLRQSFPFDTVSEVGKGIRGADCILTVRNTFGQECGTIIFESKRTKDFGGDWIDKLKQDMITTSADLAVIVTQSLPRDMDRFGEKQGVYICSFAEAKNLVAILRQAVIKVFETRKSQENKGDKMVMLYDYLTGAEFMAQWNAMRDAFRKFRAFMQKEREDFEKNWKKKEKMLETIINNSMQISGSIEGISGMERMDWNALPEDNNGLLLD